MAFAPCTKLLSILALCAPVALLYLAIFSPTWAYIDQPVYGSGPDATVVEQQARYRMGIFSNDQLIISDDRVLHKEMGYKWCGNKATLVDEPTQDLLCTLLTSTRGLVIGAVGVAVMALSFMLLVFTGPVAPKSAPTVTFISSLLSILASLAAVGSGTSWFFILQELNKGIEQNLEGATPFSVPVGQAFVYVAVSAACSLSMGIILMVLAGRMREQNKQDKESEMMREKMLMDLTKPVMQKTSWDQPIPPSVLGYLNEKKALTTAPTVVRQISPPSNVPVSAGLEELKVEEP